MLRSFEATMREDGQIELLEALQLPHPCRAIVAILSEEEFSDTALLSEAALAADWNRPEEDDLF